ncbi:hypothetical protein [Halocola ammonii]
MPTQLSNIISISRGPQFRGGKSAPLFIVFMILLVIILAFAFVVNFFVLPVLSPFLAVFILFIIDIQGIQIDRKQNKIRNYKLRLWGKTGEWIDFDTLDRIVLDLESYQIKVVSFYQRGRNTENHRRFMVSLESEKDSSANFLVYESPNYNDSKSFALKFSEKLDLPLDDRFSQRLRESRRRRKR